VKSTGTIIVAAAFAAFLAGCGGGSAPSVPSNVAAQQTVTAQPQSVLFTITVPKASTASGIRRAAYVSASTQSAVITVAPGANVSSPTSTTTTVNCTSTCTASVQAYPGSNTFTVNLYDGQNGQGFLLSTGTTTATIVAGPNNVTMTFNGVPFAVTATSNPASLSATQTSATLTFTVQDADANTITATPATTMYSSPITLASSSTHVTLSSTSLTSPSQNTVTATYDGNASICGTTVSVTATIGSAPLPPAIGIPISCGITLMPTSLSLTALQAPVNVQVSETNFTGPFTASTTTCGPLGLSVSSTNPLGPSATFSVGAGVGTGSCSYVFSDGTNTATLPITVTP
jgi:hypothetical protein